MEEPSESSKMLEEAHPPEESESGNNPDQWTKKAITEIEFHAILKKQNNAGMPMDDHIAQRAFKQLDVDNDGKIDARELHRYLVTVNGDQYSAEQVNKMIDEEAGWRAVVDAIELDTKEYDEFLKHLNDDVRDKIEQFDTNQDGKFSLTEVAKILNAFHAAEAIAKQQEELKVQAEFESQRAEHAAAIWKRVAVAITVALLAALLATFGTTLLGNEMSKEMHVENGGDLVSTDGAIVRTAPKMTERELSSRIPNKYLSQLTSFSYTDPTDGASMSVRVDSFVRIPEASAHCGSVVVLQTSLGNFTLDDTALYHGELEQWVDAAGAFNIDERRRMLKEQSGRRRLGVANGQALFSFLEDAEGEMSCSRTWDGTETVVVDPHTPIRPYAYVAHSIESCSSQPDGRRFGEATDSGISVTRAARCNSIYGPNAGHTKPGVTQDGKAMYSVQRALFTDSMSVVISQYANHPLQMLVEVENLEAVPRGGNVTKLEFQLYAEHPGKRQRCTQAEFKDPGNASFENSFLSYLGVHDQLRHWTISNEAGDRIADYFDDNTTARPHSIHFDRDGPHPSELRYVQIDEQLDADSVAAWLEAHFPHRHVYDVNDLTSCSKQDMLTDTPAVLGPFLENPDSVDWYTKKMLKVDIDSDFTAMMSETSMQRYWGSAMYLRRLLDQEVTGAYVDADEDITPETNELHVDLNFDDPWFWRELGTRLGIAGSTRQEDLQSVWLTVANSFGEPSVESVREQAAMRSGLSIEQLLSVPQPVEYVAKGTVDVVSSEWLSTTDMTAFEPNWNSTEPLDAAHVALYVVFGDGSSCLDNPFKVTSIDGLYLQVQTVVAADDLGTSSNEEILADVDLTTTAIERGRLAFLYQTYTDAAAASCDPAESIPISNTGRRLDIRQLEEKFVGGSPYVSEENSRRRLGLDWAQRAFSASKCTASGSGPGRAFVEAMGMQQPQALQHLSNLFDFERVSCGEYLDGDTDDSGRDDPTTSDLGIGDRLSHKLTEYTPQPLTVADAIAASPAWAPLSLPDADGTLTEAACTPDMGTPYTIGGVRDSATPLTLHFSAAGQITGVSLDVYDHGDPVHTEWVQTMIYRGILTPGGASAPDTLTVAFRDTSGDADLCHADTIYEERVGTQLGVLFSAEAGSTFPLTSEGYERRTLTTQLPLTASAAQEQGYHRGSCFSGMGWHYFKDLTTSDGSVVWEDFHTNLIPIVPMYDPESGQLNAFFFAISPDQAPGFFPRHPVYDPAPLPQFAMCQNMCGGFCTDLAPSGTWNTMHFYLHDHNKESLSCADESLKCLPSFVAAMADSQSEHHNWGCCPDSVDPRTGQPVVIPEDSLRFVQMQVLPCDDGSHPTCGIQFTTHLDEFPMFEDVAEALGLPALEGTFGVRTMDNGKGELTWNLPDTLCNVYASGNGAITEVCRTNSCELGVEEFLTLKLFGQPTYPYKTWWFDGPKVEWQGDLQLTRQQCVLAHQDFGLDVAKVQTDSLSASAALSFTMSYSPCMTWGGWRFDKKGIGAVAFLEGGVSGALTQLYRQDATAGKLEGFARAQFSAEYKTGRCECRDHEQFDGLEELVAKRGEECNVVLGMDMEVAVTAAISNIAIGDGDDGAHLVLIGHVMISATIGGTVHHIWGDEWEYQEPDIVDLDMLARAMDDP